MELEVFVETHCEDLSLDESEKKIDREAKYEDRSFNMEEFAVSRGY